MIHRSLNSFSLSFLSHVKNCNHKGLGIYYLLSAFIFGISGTLISVLLRIELYSSGNRIFIEKFLIFIWILFSFEILFQLYISFFFILINFSFLISLSLSFLSFTFLLNFFSFYFIFLLTFHFKFRILIFHCFSLSSIYYLFL